MIERDFIAQKTKEYYIKQHISSTLKGAEISSVTLKKIPLGEKIIIRTNRPSVVVGSKGSTIRKLTAHLKSNFQLENPRIEIEEVPSAHLDASVVAAQIAGTLERFGSARFKGVGHRSLSDVMAAGALGVEIKISGKIPGARAKSWRFYMGYLKKCGDVSFSGVRKAYASALLKTGVIGIQVRIMPADLDLPDNVEILETPVLEVEEQDAPATKKKTVKKKAKSTKKKATKKKSAGSESSEVVVGSAASEAPVEASESSSDSASN